VTIISGVPDIPVKALTINGHMLSSAMTDFILLLRNCSEKLSHCFLDVKKSSIMTILYGFIISRLYKKTGKISVIPARVA